MAEPLLATQLYAPPKPRGNISDHCAPHNAYRCAGDDDWDGHRRSHRRGMAKVVRAGCRAAPALGVDIDAGLRQVLDLSPDEMAGLRGAGALGSV